MENMPICPKCDSEYTYADGSLFVCSLCGYEWGANSVSEEVSEKVVDAHGNELKDGDSVVLVKDLKVKGSSTPIKQGTLVKNIQLIDEAGHNISCKVQGFGAMNLKSEFVKKA